MAYTDLLAWTNQLCFPDDLEKHFHKDYYQKSIAITRVAILLGLGLILLFGLLDHWAAPLSFERIWLIRFLLLAPIFLAVLLFTCSPWFERVMQPLTGLTVIIAGLGIAAMSAVTEPGEPAYTTYYAGLLLVLMWNYSFIRLRFWGRAGGGDRV